VTTTEDRWIDLCDPTEAELLAVLPPDVHEVARERLLRPAESDYEPRPRLEAHGSYLFGILAIAQYATDDEVVFQEIGVVATLNELITVRKTPPGHVPAHLDECRNAALRSGAAPGMCLYALVDEIAEQFLNLVDRFDDEIDELEDHVLDWESARIRRRVSQLRHDILHVRRVLAPTRDAARRVLDDRVELDSGALFPRDIELRFADAYDKLLRATDGLDLARDLLAGVRDFHQSEIANEQNEVTKKLAAIGSMLLVPTFIVGWYGQNFIHMPELRWQYGYQFSWFLIVSTSIGQFVYFRRKKWL
jgi:magnesium transporter